MSISHPSYKGRVALITGGRRGIGRGIARRLAAQGASIVISVLSRTEDRIEETVEMFAKNGHTLAVLECDLSDPAARVGMVARAAAFFGPVDILVNNAAANPRAAPSEMSYEQRRMMFEVNLHGPIELTQQCLPGMRERGWGRILNILSRSIDQPPIPYSGPAKFINDIVVYGASKAALERYTEGLAAELAGSGILANAVYPHQVCVTEENSEMARAALRAHPELAEGVEMMAEAAMLLIAGPLTGMSMSSRQTLYNFQQPLYALDGATVIGDANTIPELG
jgi:3-oxoacyl-[acyl-carrier protein] reductase